MSELEAKVKRIEKQSIPHVRRRQAEKLARELRECLALWEIWEHDPEMARRKIEPYRKFLQVLDGLAMPDMPKTP